MYLCVRNIFVYIHIYKSNCNKEPPKAALVAVRGARVRAKSSRSGRFAPRPHRRHYLYNARAPKAAYAGR